MGLKNHQHYYNWTIEWVEEDDDEWSFHLVREIISPYTGSKTNISTEIGSFSDIGIGVHRSIALIDEIITKQNKIAEKVLNVA
jgi:hypothetical protein